MTVVQINLCGLSRAIALNVPEERPGHIDSVLFSSAYREFFSDDDRVCDIQIAGIIHLWRDLLMRGYFFGLARLLGGSPLIALSPPLNVRNN